MVARLVAELVDDRLFGFMKTRWQLQPQILIQINDRSQEAGPRFEGIIFRV